MLELLPYTVIEKEGSKLVYCFFDIGEDKAVAAEFNQSITFLWSPLFSFRHFSNAATSQGESFFVSSDCMIQELVRQVEIYKIIAFYFQYAYVNKA